MSACVGTNVERPYFLNLQQSQVINVEKIPRMHLLRIILLYA